MKQFDLVIDDSNRVGIVTNINTLHNVYVKYLSHNGEGIYCLVKDCYSYDNLRHPTTSADIRLRYRFAQIISRITSYIRRRCRKFKLQEITMYPKLKIEVERYDEKRSRYKCNVFVNGKKGYYDLPKTIYELLKKLELSDNSDSAKLPICPSYHKGICTNTGNDCWCCAE